MLLTKLPWNYYPSPDTHGRDKVRVVLDLTNYSTRKEFNSVIGTDTSNLASERYLIAWKAEV